MSINDRNSTLNGYGDRRRYIDGLVGDYNAKIRGGKKRQNTWKRNHGMGGSSVICSQCGRHMAKHMADQQIENKRENAPICMACIMGVPRKPLIKVYHEKFKALKREEESKKHGN